MVELNLETAEQALRAAQARARELGAPMTVTGGLPPLHDRAGRAGREGLRLLKDGAGDPADAGAVAVK